MPSEISRTIPKSRREGGWMPNAKEVSKTATGEAALIIWMNCQPSLSGRAIRGRPKRLTSRGSMVMMMREKSKKYEKQMGSPQISLIISFGTLHSHKNLVPKGFFFSFLLRPSSHFCAGDVYIDKGEMRGCLRVWGRRDTARQLLFSFISSSTHSHWAPPNPRVYQSEESACHPDHPNSILVSQKSCGMTTPENTEEV